jgi:hypothetical protein
MFMWGFFSFFFPAERGGKQKGKERKEATYAFVFFGDLDEA